MNPRACYETELVFEPAIAPKRIAVVGGGAAGMSFACHAAERGHVVTLFEAQPELGGQLNYAKRVPGKEEFYEMLRYFGRRLAKAVSPCAWASGPPWRCWRISRRSSSPRASCPARPTSPAWTIRKSSAIPTCCRAENGREDVAIIGAGGIGFDVAEFLVQPDPQLQVATYLTEWGVDGAHAHRGGLLPAPQPPEPARQVYLLQRKTDRMGAGLGKTTGWIHRAVSRP